MLSRPLFTTQRFETRSQTLQLQNHKLKYLFKCFIVFTAILAAVLFLIGIAFVAGNGFYVFQIFDAAVSLPLLIIAFFQCIAVAWVYGNDR
jgi:SNF family Na+-dependent transporter